jgi:uncharacterized membrane protein
MDIITSADGWAFLLRWIHFLAGITWIGVLYYFNFIQTPFFGSELGGQAKGLMTRGLVPNALWWFRWGAMFTFLSGLAIIAIRLHQGVGLGDPYMTKILTGALMGTLMWANVWFIIWPAQKIVIANAETVAGGGEANPAAAGAGGRAGMASRTNTLFSIPMLFFMGSASHLNWAFNGTNDTVFWLGVFVLVGLFEANGLIGPGKPSQKMLTTVSGTIHAGLGVTLLLYVWGSIIL